MSDGSQPEQENAIERAWRWVKAHPKLMILLIRIIPLAFLLFGFVAILFIELRAMGYFK